MTHIEAERRYNIMAIATMICRQVGVAFSWEAYANTDIPGIGRPEELCRGDVVPYDRFRQELQDVYDITIGRGLSKEGLCGLPISVDLVNASRARVEAAGWRR